MKFINIKRIISFLISEISTFHRLNSIPQSSPYHKDPMLFSDLVSSDPHICHRQQEQQLQQHQQPISDQHILSFVDYQAKLRRKENVLLDTRKILKMYTLDRLERQEVIAQEVIAQELIAQELSAQQFAKHHPSATCDEQQFEIVIMNRTSRQFSVCQYPRLIFKTIQDANTFVKVHPDFQQCFLGSRHLLWVIVKHSRRQNIQRSPYCISMQSLL